MTETRTVNAPTGLRTISKMRWSGPEQISEEELQHDRGFAARYGHTVHEWDAAAQNPDGTTGARQTWLNVVSRYGYSLELYLIEYPGHTTCGEH